MAGAWIELVDVDQVVEGEAYFLAIRSQANTTFESYRFYAADIRGKRILSHKPGIATRIIGHDKLRNIVREHEDHVAIEGPVDADQPRKRR